MKIVNSIRSLAAAGAMLAMAAGTANATLIDLTDFDTFAGVADVGDLTTTNPLLSEVGIAPAFSIASVPSNIGTDPAFVSPIPLPGTTTTLAGDFDGLGISDDEVSNGGTESLTVTFLSVVSLTQIILLDAFEGIGQEDATISVDGGTAVLASSILGSTETNGPAGGVRVIDFATALIGSVFTFTAASLPGDSTNDYALAGLDVTPVPIPAALPLFGGALSLLGFLGWRRRRTAR